MPSTPPKSALFEDAIDILLWLESDRETPHATRRHRDRVIGQSLSTPDQSIQRVRSWWSKVKPYVAGVKDTDSEGQRRMRITRMVSLLVFILGLVGGMGLIVAVFQYDGSYPINIVTLLALFVLLQGVLMLLSLALLLPEQGLVSRLLSIVNVGAMISTVMQRKFQRHFTKSFTTDNNHSLAHERLYKWMFIRWSQLMGVGFNLGALISGMLLIVFTDLAFGWSSTLVLETGEFRSLIHVLTAPWSQFWVDAVPADALIEQSRFYRLDSSSISQSKAQSLTGWWPFVVACILFYGLLPRLLLLVWASAFLRRATLHLLLKDPSVLALFERMNTPELKLGSVTPAVTVVDLVEEGAPKPERISGTVPLVIWAESAGSENVIEYIQSAFGIQVGNIFDAGGLCSLNDDAHCQASLSASRPPGVLITVKAWEPPLNDLLDFLSVLRSKLDASTSIIVAPVGQEYSQVQPKQIRIWRHALKGLHDSALYVESGL